MKKNLLLLLILFLAAFLRFYQLDLYPAGLNADEAAIGYNAYSLIQTGKDEHGVSWPLVFQSFNDYKPPLYFYLTIPFVKFIGLNTLAVRLPSAILGVFSVYLIYLFSLELFKKRTLGLIAALLLAISPWHLHFSRGAWEVNAATFFLLLGLWAFIKAVKNPLYFFLSAFSICLSLYTYHSIRLIAPFLGLYLFFIYYKKIIETLKITPWKIILPVSLFVLILIPLGNQMLSKEGQARFGGVSLFADQGPLWQALEYRRGHNNPNSLYIRAIHNRYLSYSVRFFQNYLSHFSPKFLFVSGDEIARNRIPEMGQSYPILFLFLIFGVYRLCQIKTKESKLVIFWLLVSPLAAALTFQSPHALRSQNMVIPLTITTALGVYSFFVWLNQIKPKIINYLTILIFSFLLIFAFTRYLHLYYVHYPKELSYAWEYGFDKVADYLKQNQDKYDQIIISDHYDQPYIILAFYLKYPPEKLQTEIKLTARDKFGFSTVKNFGKYEFRQVNYDQDKNLDKTLIIATEETVSDEKVIYTVESPLNEPLFKFIDTSKE